MSFANERTSIESRLNSNWTTTTIEWENVDFDTPNNADVVCGVASMANVGTSDIWYQINITIPYRRDA